MEDIIQEMNHTLDEIVYHSDIYNIQTYNMDNLIYKYFNVDEEEALIETYDDRIEIMFYTPPDEQVIKKLYELSDEIGTTITFIKGKYSVYILKINARISYN